jgi:hypothetical protein
MYFKSLFNIIIPILLTHLAWPKVITLSSAFSIGLILVYLQIFVFKNSQQVLPRRSDGRPGIVRRRFGIDSSQILLRGRDHVQVVVQVEPHQEDEAQGSHLGADHQEAAVDEVIL